MEEIITCPNCGENENLHYNYAWHLPNIPVVDVLCNECGECFKLEENTNQNKS